MFVYIKKDMVKLVTNYKSKKAKMKITFNENENILLRNQT